jgi:hypothetical protein
MRPHHGSPAAPECSNHAVSRPKNGRNARRTGPALPSINGHGAQAHFGPAMHLKTIFNIYGKHYI